MIFLRLPKERFKKGVETQGKFLESDNIPSNSVLIVEAVTRLGRVADTWVGIDAGGFEIAISYTITTAKGGILGISNTCTGRTASERLVYGSGWQVFKGNITSTTEKYSILGSPLIQPHVFSPTVVSLRNNPLCCW